MRMHAARHGPGVIPLGIGMGGLLICMNFIGNVWAAVRQIRSVAWGAVPGAGP